MNLRQLAKYILWRDTTHNGEFRTMWRLLTPDTPKVVVDVGANDGFYGSNSFPFVARGWRAVLIEPHPVAFARLQKRFARASRVTCLNVACAESSGKRPLYLGTDPSLSTLCTLADVLSARQIPHDFGVLSIDTEGMDYEVLLGLQCPVWRPRLIITEDYKPKEAAKADYLNENGYRLRARIFGNTIWTTP